MDMRIIPSSVLALALTGTLIAGGAQALADPAARPRSLEPSVTVRFADLNLNSPAGARVLYGRIQSAAQTVCGPSFSLWNGSQWHAWKECYRTTIDAAVRQIDRPVLTALHLHLTAAKPG
jgi:UrcA family protein